MRKCYRIPIQGKVLQTNPLTGDPNDPIVVFPISELPNKPDMGFSYQCLEYNIEEGWCEIELEAEQPIHDWLQGHLTDGKDIKAIQEAKHLELDISEMELDEN